MNKNEFDEMLMKVLKSGVDVTMTMVDDVLWYDLNTGMKSEMMVTFTARCLYKSRYESGTVFNFDHLLSLVEDCKCGRDFMNPQWEKLLG